MPDSHPDDRDEELLNFGHSGSHTPEQQLDEQVQRAQEQLRQLHRQQEQIERQKRELEELSRKQEQFEAGRGEMIEKFSRVAGELDRELRASRARVSELESIQGVFSQHLDVLEAIDSRTWDPADMPRELARGMAAVAEAKKEFQRHANRLDEEPHSGGLGYEDGSGESQDFLHWLKLGAAFTAPLCVVGIIIIIIIANKP